MCPKVENSTRISFGASGIDTPAAVDFQRTFVAASRRTLFAEVLSESRLVKATLKALVRRAGSRRPVFL
jgi:hypothetical protein